MSTTTRRSLAEIEADIKALPLWLPPRVFRHKLERLHAEWTAENLRLFDVVADHFARDWQRLIEQLEAAEGDQ